MGIQIQPFCCSKWVAISNFGWLYDIDLEGGQLSNARYFGVSTNNVNSSDGGQGGAGSPIYRDGRLYFHTHALAVGWQSKLYSMTLDATAVVIGNFRPIVASGTVTQGATGNCLFTLPNGECFAWSAGGAAQRSARLLSVDFISGAGTEVSPGVDLVGNVLVDPGSNPIAPVPTGCAAHPTNGKVYMIGIYTPATEFFVWEVDVGTGLVSAQKATTMTTSQGFPFCFAFDEDGVSSWHAYEHVYHCDDVRAANPNLVKGPAITGWKGPRVASTAQPYTESITGIVRVDG